MTLEIPKTKFEDFKKFLTAEGYSFEQRPHQYFLARNTGLVVNLYNSGKIVLAGKDTFQREKIEHYLKSQNAKQVIKQEKDYGTINVTGTRIGTDEAGKAGN